MAWPPPAQANLENLIQQYMRQGRPIVRAELIFVRKVCRAGHRTVPTDQSRCRGGAQGCGHEAGRSTAARADAGPNPAGDRPDAAHCRWTLASARRLGVRHEETTSLPSNSPTIRPRSRSATPTGSRRRSAILVDAIDRELYLSDEQRAQVDRVALFPLGRELEHEPRVSPVRQPVLSRWASIPM